MRVLVVNAGSSSLKLRVLGDTDAVESTLDLERWSGDASGDQLTAFVRDAGAVDAVGHRVVHGGNRFRAATRITVDGARDGSPAEAPDVNRGSTAVLHPVGGAGGGAAPVGPERGHGGGGLDDAVVDELTALTELAPLHQPRALSAIRALNRLLPDVPAVACFDTTFHADLPAPASTVALPSRLRERFGLRRFGFHGLSHAYAARRALALAGAPSSARVVTCHLGAGASLAAVRQGRSRDTTMGFTPLEGLVMATRCGSLDPGLVLWLLEHGGLSVGELGGILERESGLAGLSGVGGDLRDVYAAADDGDDACALAIEVYLHRLRADIAAMTAALGGLDVLVFTGGVGEHQPRVRAATAAGLAYLGVAVDDDANAAAPKDAVISAADARVSSVVVTAREDLEIARQTRAALAD